MGGWLRTGSISSSLLMQRIQTGVDSVKAVLASFSSLIATLISFTHEGTCRSDLYAW